MGEAAALAIPTANHSLAQKIPRSYTDSLGVQLQSDNPSSFITYAIEVLNAGGRGAGLSNQVRVSLVRTLPPPREFAARVTGQGVVLTWANDVASVGFCRVRYVYRVYRRQEGSAEQILAGQVPAGSDPIVTLTDSNIEWEKTYEYRAETVTVVAAAEQA